MKVYLQENGGRRLVGRADVPAGHRGPVVEIPVPGAPPTAAVERFAIGAMEHLPPAGGAPVMERVILMAPGQIATLLPGWVRLAA